MIIEHSCFRYSEKISHYRIIQTGSFSRHTLSHLFFKSIFFYLRISKRPQPDYYYYASENSFQIKQNESGTNTELT